MYALHSFLHFPQKHLEIKKKSGNLATLSYLTELSRMLKFSKEEKQEVVTQIVPTSIIFDFPGFSVLYSPFANHFAKKRSLTKQPFGVLLISYLSTRAFRAVFTLLVAGRWWVKMNCCHNLIALFTLRKLRNNYRGYQMFSNFLIVIPYHQTSHPLSVALVQLLNGHWGGYRMYLLA